MRMICIQKVYFIYTIWAQYVYTLCANMTLPTREVPSEVSVIPDLCQPTVRRQDLVLLVNVDNLNNMQMKNQFCESPQIGRFQTPLSDWSRFLSSSLLNLVQRNAELNSEWKTRVLNRTHRLLVVRQQVSGLTLAELFLLQINVGIKSMLDSLIRYIRGVEIISGQFR